MIVTFVNYFKMQLRNDTLLMEDISLIKEAISISIKKNYTYTFTPAMIVCFIALIALTVALYLVLDRKNKFHKDEKIIIKVLKKVLIVIVFVVVAFVSLEKIYIKGELFYANYKKIDSTKCTIYF